MRRAAALLGGVTTAVVALAGSAATGATAVGAAAPGGGATQLGAVLVGGNEVPGPGDPDGWGLADVSVDKQEVCWRISVQGVGPITAAHIHPGPAGVSGPVAVPLEPFRRGCTDVRPRTARFIAEHPTQFYVNVHNAGFPSGALRGQLEP